MTAVLEVEDLRMSYGATEVLHDVSFRVDRGEVLCLLGPNGAGKTTTIEILEGFRSRSAGRVEVLGSDPEHAGERWRARVGVVLQSWRDHNRWRVRELLDHLGTYYRGHQRPPWPTAELLAAVGLTAHAEQRIRTLSGGQRRRLDVAIGLVGRPEVLFLDEPTAGLDPEARREFHDLIRGLAADRSTTVLLTTHDLVEAEKLATRIVILDRGRIVADGTPTELARRIAGRDEVGWTLDGHRHTRSTADSTAFVIDLVHRHGTALSEVEITRSSLEDTYLALVREAEATR